MFRRDWIGKVETPAFVLDLRRLEQSLIPLESVRRECGVKVLFALNASSHPDAIELISGRLDGFAVSSEFDAMWSVEAAKDKAEISITSPVLSYSEAERVVERCRYVVLNSINQWNGVKEPLAGRASFGLRVHPGVTFLDDPRCDPARPDSKLGVPIDLLRDLYLHDPNALRGLDGIQFHTHCESKDFAPLLNIVKLLCNKLEPMLARLKWINLGGGYLFRPETDLAPFYEAVELLQSRFGLQVIIEPGFSVISSAGFLASTVLDIVPSTGCPIAMLDTTVNHAPEVFEFQCPPPVLGQVPNGRFNYVIAGRSCLAGDLFGEYAFAEPLKTGSSVIFTDLGAYTMVKAHTFNGINLPTQYILTERGDLVLRRRYTYEDYKARIELRGLHAVI